MSLRSPLCEDDGCCVVHSTLPGVVLVHCDCTLLKPDDSGDDTSRFYEGCRWPQISCPQLWGRSVLYDEGDDRAGIEYLSMCRLPRYLCRRCVAPEGHRTPGLNLEIRTDCQYTGCRESRSSVASPTKCPVVGYKHLNTSSFTREGLKSVEKTRTEYCTRTS